jgi:hypothetical protein
VKNHANYEMKNISGEKMFAKEIYHSVWHKSGLKFLYGIQTAVKIVFFSS